MSFNDGRLYNIFLSEITIAFYYRAEIKINFMIEISDMLKMCTIFLSRYYWLFMLFGSSFQRFTSLAHVW